MVRHKPNKVHFWNFKNISPLIRYKVHCKIFTIIDTLVLLHNLSAIGPIMIENTGGINSNVVTKEIANEFNSLVNKKWWNLFTIVKVWGYPFIYLKPHFTGAWS